MDDIIGQTFGLLRVVRRDGYKPNGKKPESAWLCQCECGTEKTIARSALVKGMTRSCGCLFSNWLESDRKHGHAKKSGTSAEYRSYHAMRRRCYCESNKDYPAYGGRGIEVCDRWLCGSGGHTGFELFLMDMGRKPTPRHTIERCDTNSNYSPENCIWATPKQQSRNRRTSIKDGDLPLMEISEKTGINYFTLFSRWKAGDRGERLTRSTSSGERRI